MNKRTFLSPLYLQAERRQSLMFTVVNTPKNNSRGDSRLQRGLNKLRNSARKSPAVASRALRSAASAVNGKSPLDSRKSPRNKSPKAPNAKKVQKHSGVKKCLMRAGSSIQI